MSDTYCELTIVWVDESKEPLKAIVDSAITEYGFLVVDLAANYLPVAAESKTLIIPAHKIDSAEVVVYKEGANVRVTDTNTFREEPGKSPHFRGMGQVHVSK